MKARIALSFLAALAFHALVLFCLHLGTPAKALDESDDPSAVDVSLADAPETPAAVAPEPTPAPTPEPTPAPTPEPTPQPTPEPMPTPDELAVSSPTPAAATPTPAPTATPKPAPKPRPSQASKPNPQASTKPSSTVKTTGPVSSNSGRTPQVGARARHRSNPEPEYPIEARRKHQQGTVWLTVVVGADGRAKSVTLKTSSGFPSLDQSAIETVRRAWMFDPGTIAGVAIESTVTQPVEFKLR